jgi:hypothetical protein
MSKVAIIGNASGTGVFTVASPNSNVDRTLTLPDESGTLLTTTGTIPTGTANGVTYLNGSKVLTSGSALTLDASGNLLVGATARGIVDSTSFDLDVSNGVGYFNHVTGTAGGIPFQQYGYAGGVIGSITQSGTTGVSYNTSSDYRLKEDWQPMTGATERVKALKPVNFAWKADGSRVDGFLAHEAQEVVPECVTGAKDAVDVEGKPNYQGIDQSKLVPLLTAALQEALTKIDALTARIEALETAP